MGSEMCIRDSLQTIGHSFSSVRAHLDAINYVGPLREHPRRFYETSSELPASVGARGQNTSNLLRANWDDYRDELNKWVRAFEFGEELLLEEQSEEVFTMQFRERKSRAKRNIADAGFGASQVLPLIAQAITARSSSLTIAEQPEIHLNPRLQSTFCLLYTSPSPRDATLSRMPSSA